MNETPLRRNVIATPLQRRGFFISFAFGFFCLISLVSSFAKEETRETRRKEKKEERLPRSRLPFDKIPGVWRGEFYLLLCVTCGFSTSANSAGPNHSLRIRWSEEMVGSMRWSTSYPVGDDVLGVPKNRTVI